MAEMWYKDDNMTPNDIAKLLRRDKSTMTRLLVKRDERLARGRPKSLSVEEVDHLVDVLGRMIIQADGEYEVTANLLRREVRLKVSTRTILRQLHARKIFVRRLH